MTDEQIATAKWDLLSQAHEHCRKVLASIQCMSGTDSEWKRDAFYREAMQHMAMLEQQLGVWRCKASLLHRETALNQAHAKSGTLTETVQSV
jgi:hypothetical protein